MIEEKQKKQILDTFSAVLNDMNFKYDIDAEDGIIEYSAVGDDFPIPCKFIVDGNTDLALLISYIPIGSVEGERGKFYEACNLINTLYMDGTFAIDSDGDIMFKITQSVAGSLIGKAAFAFMINYTFHIVDKFNDKFALLKMGKIEPKDFLK